MRPLLRVGVAMAIGSLLGSWLRISVRGRGSAVGGHVEALGGVGSDADDTLALLLLTLLGLALFSALLKLRSSARRAAVLSSGATCSIRDSFASSVPFLAILCACAARAVGTIAEEARYDPLQPIAHVSLVDYLEARRPALLAGAWREDRRRSDGKSGYLAACSAPVRIGPKRGTRPRGWNGDELALLSPGSPLLAARSLASEGEAPLLRSLRIDIEVLYRNSASGRAWGPLFWVRSWRAKLVRICASIEDPATAGLVSALVLGDRARMPTELSDLFTRTGTRHLLSLSGLHVALIAVLLARPIGSFVGWLAGLLSRACRGGSSMQAGMHRLATLVAVVIVCLLIPLGGATPPVARAAVAIGVALLGPVLPGRRGGFRHAGRGVDARNLWGLALALECALDPLAPTRVGVQLSYSATLALLCGMNGMKGWMQCLLGGPGGVSKTGRLGQTRDPRWQIPLTALLRGAKEGVAASALATLATLPIVWFAFGEFSPIGILATPLVIPCLTLLIVSGWAWLLFPFAVGEQWPQFASAAMLRCLEVADQLPGTPIPLAPRPLFLLVPGCLCLLIGMLRGPTAPRRCLRVGALLLGICCLPWPQPVHGLELVACDVGNGTAILMRAPGLPALIFDAGSRDRSSVGRSAIAPLLRRWEVEHPIYVLSHEHRDHAAAFPWLVERWPPSLWAGALPEDLRSRIPAETPCLDLEGGSLRIPIPSSDPGAPIIEIWRGSTLPGNEGSRSIHVHCGGQNLLLTGDAEGAGLNEMLAGRQLGFPLDLLVSPHHGSHTPLLGALLRATTPGRLWASATGVPAIAEQLRGRGLPLEFTSRDGPLWFRGEPLGVPREQEAQ